MKFTQDALWDYCTRLYANNPVEKACLLLQDKHQLNVNLVLTCFWLSHELHEVQTKTFFKKLLAEIDPIQKTIINPVRTSRKNLKLKPSRWPDEFKTEVRENLLQIELNAEKLQITSIQVFTRSAKRRTMPRIKDFERVKRNMVCYLSAAKLSIEIKDIECFLLEIERTIDADL